LITAIHSGSRAFGKGGTQRERTVQVLSGAGLDREAVDFLPPLDQARQRGDLSAMLVHARYKQYLADHLREGDETDRFRLEAWELLREVLATGRASREDCDDAMRRAITIMRELPRAKIEPWLKEVFADHDLAPLAMEKIALIASSLADEQIERSQRVRALVTLKEAVDILLGSSPTHQENLRIPLRMLTTTIAQEIEAALPGNQREDGPPIDRAMLMRAVPDAAWLDALEPSLAVRVSGASIELATCLGQMDQALDQLRAAVRRNRDQAGDLAERFLKRWATTLEALGDGSGMSYNSWTGAPQRYYSRSPITRGLQRRNLQALREVLDAVEAAGVDVRTLPSIAKVFAACHNAAEVFEEGDIERVFGSIDQIPARTARDLAESISETVERYWRNHLAQRKNKANASGPKLPPLQPNVEIAQAVDRGLAAAQRLARQAQDADPTNWENDQVQALLSYRRLAFNQKLGSIDDATKLARLRDTYASFEKAAASYATALAGGSQKETARVFTLWFNTAMGTANVSLLTLDDLPTEGSLQENQFERIGAALAALPADVSFRHRAEFALAVNDSINTLPPEVKPRFVEAALRIVGQHPAAAPIQRRYEFYRELMKDEVRLRLTIDGSDEVRAGRPFALMVSLRVTHAVERDSPDFSKYLQNGVSIPDGRGDWREINYKDLLEQEIEEAFSHSFDLNAIGFFEPLQPFHAVIEDGQGGWIEKPLAYVIVTPKDSSVDRLPQITMEMQFGDGGGYVNVVASSNTPSIAVGPAFAARPCLDLRVTQIIDARDAVAGAPGRPVRLEVTARGRGSVPDLDELLAGLDSALPGYTIGADRTESRPTAIWSDADVNAASTRRPGQIADYPEPDHDGLVRPVVERSWVITYSPNRQSNSAWFRLPQLVSDVHAALDSKYYAELDIAPVRGDSLNLGIAKRNTYLYIAGSAGILIALTLLVACIRRRRRVPASAPALLTMPERVTPLSVVTTLRRWQQQSADRFSRADQEKLAVEIQTLERAYFGPGAETPTPPELGSILSHWTSKTSSTSVPARVD
jgi:hypothetical protein